MAETLERVHGTLAQMQKNLECSICLELLTDPVLTKCEHHFCNFCILSLLQSRRRQTAPCPLCKEPLTKRGLIKHESLKNIVDAYRCVVQAVEDDTGRKCTPPRGPVRFSQPEPVSQRPRQPVKKTTAKRNVRRGKRKGEAEIPIHLDSGTEGEAVKKAGKRTLYNVNTRSSFPSSKGTIKEPASHELSDKKGSEENHIPGSIQTPDILDALAGESLGQTKPDQNDSAFICRDKNNSDRILAEKLVNGNNMPSSADPYEFIASQRTPRKVKRRAPKDKKKKRPWEYSFGKISRKKNNAAVRDVPTGEGWQSDDDEEDSSLVHREDIVDQEEGVQDGQRSVGNPDDENRHQDGNRVIGHGPGDIDRAGSSNDVVDIGGKEDHELTEEQNERAIQRDDSSDGEEVIEDLEYEGSDDGADNPPDDACGDNEEVGYEGRQTSPSKALDAIQDHRLNGHDPLDEEGHHRAPLCEETQEPHRVGRTKEPLNVQQRPYYNPTDTDQGGMPPSQPPVLNRNHGNKVFAKTYGRGKTKSPPKDERVKSRVGEDDDALPDVMSIGVDVDDADNDSRKGDSQEVHLEDVGLQDEVGDHGASDPMYLAAEVNGLENREDVIAPDEDDVVDLTLDEEDEEGNVDRTTVEQLAGQDEENAQMGNLQNHDDVQNGEMVTEIGDTDMANQDRVSIGETRTGNPNKKNNVNEGDMPSGSPNASRFKDAVEEDEGGDEQSGKKAKKRLTLKEKMRNKEGLVASEQAEGAVKDQQEQSDWEMALKLAEELGSVPPDLEARSLRTRKGKNSGDGERERKGRRAKQLTIKNGPEPTDEMTKMKRGSRRGGLRSLEENHQQETVEISSFKDESEIIGGDTGNIQGGEGAEEENVENEEVPKARVDEQPPLNKDGEKRRTRSGRKEVSVDGGSKERGKGKGKRSNEKKKGGKGMEANDVISAKVHQVKDKAHQGKAIKSSISEKSADAEEFIHDSSDDPGNARFPKRKTRKGDCDDGKAQSLKGNGNCADKNVVETGSIDDNKNDLEDQGNTPGTAREDGTPQEMVKCVPETPYPGGVHLENTLPDPPDANGENPEVIENEIEEDEVCQDFQRGSPIQDKNISSNCGRDKTKDARGNRNMNAENQVNSGQNKDFMRNSSGKKQRAGPKEAVVPDELIDKVNDNMERNEESNSGRSRSTRRKSEDVKVVANGPNKTKDSSKDRKRVRHRAGTNEQPGDAISDERTLRKSSRLSKEKVERSVAVMDAGIGQNEEVEMHRETLSKESKRRGGRRRSSRLQQDTKTAGNSNEEQGDALTAPSVVCDNIPQRDREGNEILMTGGHNQPSEDQLQGTKERKCLDISRERIQTEVDKRSIIGEEETGMSGCNEMGAEDSVKSTGRGGRSTRRLHGSNSQEEISARTSRSQDKEKANASNNSSEIQADNAVEDISRAGMESSSDGQRSKRGSSEGRLNRSQEPKRTKGTSSSRTMQKAESLGEGVTASDKCSEVIVVNDDDNIEDHVPKNIEAEEQQSSENSGRGNQRSLRSKRSGSLGSMRGSPGLSKSDGILDSAKLDKCDQGRETNKSGSSNGAISDVALFEGVIHDDSRVYVAKGAAADITRNTKGTQKSPSSTTLRGGVSGSSTESIQIDDSYPVYAESDVMNAPDKKGLGKELVSRTSLTDTKASSQKRKDLPKSGDRNAGDKPSRTLRSRSGRRKVRETTDRSENGRDEVKAAKRTEAEIDSQLTAKNLSESGGNDKTTTGSKDEVHESSGGVQSVRPKEVDGNGILDPGDTDKSSGHDNVVEKQCDGGTDQSIDKSLHNGSDEASARHGGSDCDEYSPDIFTMQLGGNQAPGVTGPFVGEAGKVSKLSKGKGKKKKKRKTFAFGNNEMGLEGGNNVSELREEPILRGGLVPDSSQKDSLDKPNEKLEDVRVGQVTQMTEESVVSEQFVPATMGASESLGASVELPGLRPKRLGCKNRVSGEVAEKIGLDRDDVSLEGCGPASEKSAFQKGRGKRTSADATEASGEQNKRYHSDLPEVPHQEEDNDDDDDEGSVIPPTQPTDSEKSEKKAVREERDNLKKVGGEVEDGEGVSMVETFKRIGQARQSSVASQRKATEEGSLSLGSPSISLLQGVHIMDEANGELEEDLDEEEENEDKVVDDRVSKTSAGSRQRGKRGNGQKGTRKAQLEADDINAEDLRNNNSGGDGAEEKVEKSNSQSKLDTELDGGFLKTATGQDEYEEEKRELAASGIVDDDDVCELVAEEDQDSDSEVVEERVHEDSGHRQGNGGPGLITGEGMESKEVIEDGTGASKAGDGEVGEDGKDGRSKPGMDQLDDDIYDAEFGEEPLFDDDCVSQSSVSSRHNLTSASSVLSSQSDLMNSQQQENAKETLRQMKQEIAEMERALAEEAGIEGARAPSVGDVSDDSDLEAVDLGAPGTPGNSGEKRFLGRRTRSRGKTGCDTERATGKGAAVIDGGHVSDGEEEDDVKVIDESKSQGGKSRLRKSRSVRNSDDSDSNEDGGHSGENGKRHRKGGRGGRSNKNNPNQNNADIDKTRDEGDVHEDDDDIVDHSGLRECSTVLLPKTSGDTVIGAHPVGNGREEDFEGEGIGPGQRRSLGAMGAREQGKRRSERGRHHKTEGSKDSGRRGRKSLGRYGQLQNIDSIEDEQMAEDVQKSISGMAAAEESLKSIMKTLAAQRHEEEVAEREREEEEQQRMKKKEEGVVEDGGTPSPLEVGPSPSSPRSPSPPPAISQRTLLRRVSPLKEEVERVKRKISGDNTCMSYEKVTLVQTVSENVVISGTSIGSQKKRRRVVVEESSSEEDDVEMSQPKRIKKRDSLSPHAGVRNPTPSHPSREFSKEAAIGNKQGLSPPARTIEVTANVTEAERNSSIQGQKRVSSEGEPTRKDEQISLTDSMGSKSSRVINEPAQLTGEAGRPADRVEQRGTPRNPQQTPVAPVADNHGESRDAHHRKKARKGESMSLITTGLNKHKLKLVDRLCKKAGCRFSGVFTPDTTHVIVNADEDLICERTLKYFQGIAAQRWIISYQWVEDSLSASRLLPQDKYEIRGDTVNGRNHCGPRRARLWKGPPLLSDYKFYCMEPFTGLTTDQLQELLRSCGGNVVDHPQTLLPPEEGKENLIIAQADASETPPEYNDLYQGFKVPIVSREWVLDSIAIYTAQPINDYLLCDVTEDDEGMDQLDSDDGFF